MRRREIFFLTAKIVVDKASKMEEFNNDVHRCVAKLDDANKVERKRNVEKMKNLIEQKFPTKDRLEADDQEQLLTLWQDRLSRPLLRCLGSDPSERVREVSGELVLFVLDRIPNFESRSGSADFIKMDYLFPLLQSRLVSKLVKKRCFWLTKIPCVA